MKKRTIIFISITVLIIIVSIIYNTFPRLQLNGSKNITMSYRDEYEEAGVIVKNATGNNMSKIKIDNNIDKTKIGNYYVDYSLKIGTKTLRVRRNVKVIDDISPVIKLNGNQIIEISINSEYKESGFTAVDEYDGDITDKVEIIGEVNSEKYGEYVITYKVHDNSNNVTQVNRIVKVIDEEPPTIECQNDYSVLEQGKPIGCKAIDNFDGDITNKIEISGNYDINKKGIYKVTYTVSDDAGNKIEKEHNIIIHTEKEKPIAYLVFNNIGNNKETILELLEKKQIKSTFLVTKQTKEEDNNYLNKIIQIESEIGITDTDNQNIYKDYNMFTNYFMEIQNQIKDITGKTATIYNFTNKEKITPQLYKKIKEYLSNNNIEYYNYDINLVELNKEEIENMINQIIKNENHKIIIMFNNIKQQENSQETISTIIDILNQMNYSFDTLSNYKTK